MFGEVQINQIIDLNKEKTLDEAAAKLLEFTEFPKIHRWIQFPTAVVVFLHTPMRSIVGPSTFTTASGASGFGLISMTEITVGTARGIRYSGQPMSLSQAGRIARSALPSQPMVHCPPASVPKARQVGQSESTLFLIPPKAIL